MSEYEDTVQQRDPLAALIGRPTSYLAGILVPLYAVIVTCANWQAVVNPTLAVLALLLVVGASVVLVVQSSAVRTPLTARTHAAIVGFALAAMLVSALSMWGANSHLGDDWGVPTVGLFIISLAPYRPAKELLVSGVLSAIFAAVVALVQADSSVAAAPPSAFMIAAAAPIVAMSLGTAAFVDVLVRSLARSRVRADRALTAMTGARGESMARSVQRDNVTLLNHEVVPFFTSLLDGKIVDEQTRQRAREIADEVRALMVADVDRTWLDGVVEQASRDAHAPSTAVSTVVRDELRLAEQMSADERTAMRAFIMALLADPSFADDGAEIGIVRDGDRCEVVVRATLHADQPIVKGRLAPFIAVLRVVFGDLQIDHEQPALILRFSYEQR